MGRRLYAGGLFAFRSDLKVLKNEISSTLAITKRALGAEIYEPAYTYTHARAHTHIMARIPRKPLEE